MNEQVIARVGPQRQKSNIHRYLTILSISYLAKKQQVFLQVLSHGQPISAYTHILFIYRICYTILVTVSVVKKIMSLFRKAGLKENTKRC
jgi:hypothetical protein